MRHSPRSSSSLCSWEVPYDFTPRIHRYPGVEHGVVRKAWTEAPPPAPPEDAAAEGDGPPSAASLHSSRRRRRIQWRVPESAPRPTGPLKQPQPPPSPSPSPPQKQQQQGSANAAQMPRRWQRTHAPTTGSGQPPTTPRTSRTPKPSPPQRQPVGEAKQAEQPVAPPAEPDAAEAPTTAVVLVPPRQPVRPPPSSLPMGVPGPHVPSSQPAPSPPADAPRRRLHRHSTQQQEHRHPSGRRYTTEDIAQLLQRSQPRQAQAAHVAADTCATAATGEGHGRNRYAPRTVLAYTLPAHIGQWRRWLQAHHTVPVVFADSHRSRHTPRALHTVSLPRQRSQRLTTHTLSVLRDAWAGAFPRGATAASFPFSLSTAGRESDFSANRLDTSLHLCESRLAALDALEDRVYDRLVGGVVPLEDVLTTDESTARVGLDGVAVLDSGHVDDPIVVTGGEHTASPSEAPVPVEEGSVAVLVRPIEAEVLPAASLSTSPSIAVARHPRRPAMLPRGREWDRQRAIQSAVGPTAQEALIDLQIDPRYRRPGEYVRWRHDGGQRRAVK